MQRDKKILYYFYDTPLTFGPTSKAVRVAMYGAALGQKGRNRGLVYMRGKHVKGKGLTVVIAPFPASGVFKP